MKNKKIAAIFSWAVFWYLMSSDISIGNIPGGADIGRILLAISGIVVGALILNKYIEN